MTFEQLISSSSDFRLSAGVHSREKKKKKSLKWRLLYSLRLWCMNKIKGAGKCEYWAPPGGRQLYVLGSNSTPRRREQTLGPVAVWENGTTSRKTVHFTLVHTCFSDVWNKHSGSQPFFFPHITLLSHKQFHSVLLLKPVLCSAPPTPAPATKSRKL